MESQANQPASTRIKSEIRIIKDDVSLPEVNFLLDAHIKALRAINAANDQLGHLLDLSALRHLSITIFTARSAASNEVMGCAALKQISLSHGELKSMRTAEGHQRQGVAGALIRHILDEAKVRSYKRVSLETGAWEEFAAARALYAKYGFVSCGPYEGYEDATSVEMSVFMTYFIS
jgi:putative acetyltransferase